MKINRNNSKRYANTCQFNKPIERILSDLEDSIPTEIEKSQLERLTNKIYNKYPYLTKEEIQNIIIGICISLREVLLTGKNLYVKNLIMFNAVYMVVMDRPVTMINDLVDNKVVKKAIRKRSISVVLREKIVLSKEVRDYINNITEVIEVL